MPIYANLRSTSQALNLAFRGDEGAGKDTAISFLNLRDLLDFQQAITGYKVVLGEPDIKALIYQVSGLFGGKKTTESGRVQLWTPRRLERRIPHAQSPGIGSPNQGLSATTASSTAVSTAKTFSTSHTSPVESENTLSYNFELPGFPILVLYLQVEKNTTDRMNLLVIQRESISISLSTA